jgi:GAF domain-containing protein
MVVEDASQDERFYNNPVVTDWPHIRFYAGAAIVTGDGYKIGSLCVIDRVPRADISDAQKDHLASLADIAMDQIELSLANRKAGRQIERLQKHADPHTRGHNTQTQSVSDQAQTSTRAGAPNLLLAGVDDSAVALLQTCGCIYERCDDPAGMVDIMAERGEDFDAVLLGCHDQGVSVGKSACKLVRHLRTMKNRCFRKLPVIGLTARMDSQSFELCMQAGMNDVLQTPLKSESLRNCLREYLGADMPDMIAGDIQS